MKMMGIDDLVEKLKTHSLDSILNAILNSKTKIHKQEFRETIGWIYEQWKEAKSRHAKYVLRGAYKKFCDTYCHTFGEIYQNSLHRDIRQDIQDTMVKAKYGK